MIIEPIEINLELKNQKVKFEGISKSSPQKPIVFDYLPPVGDGEGFLGLEMMVMSFAGCVSTAIVALFKKMGKKITEYKMNAIGIKRETPLTLKKYTLKLLSNLKNSAKKIYKRS